jgi:predicted MFS family arabinose efflux permease
MATTTESWPGRLSLMVAHCAGMLDLVALPVWVGVLISHYKFEPRDAGGLATLFLVGAVVSSLFFASRFTRLNARLFVVGGFAMAAAAFFLASRTTDYKTLAGLHLVAGAAAACGLSFTHGTIARSGNPHRLFAVVGMALGIFAIVFLGATPNLVAALGGPILFVVFAAVMAVAAVTSLFVFPGLKPKTETLFFDRVARIRPSIWFGVIGVSCMGLTQAMMFSFIERIGADRGFGTDAVTGVLIALGFVNLIPAPLAAFLETRVSARAVLLVGPALQALIAVAIAVGSGFPLYAAPTAVFAAVMIFTHTFAFGLLSRLDPSSRVVAGTPAMLMIGAAIGPVLGGTLVQSFGYGALAIAAVIIDAVAILLFSRVPLPDSSAIANPTLTVA